MKNKSIQLILPILVFVITGVLLALAIAYSWLGAEKEGIMLFCEYNENGFIKQPANSYSNLAFSFVGLYIAWFSFKDQFTESNLFSNRPIYPISLSIVLILLGAGSFAMHATNTPWGGFFDLMAMFLIISLFFGIVIKRMWHISDTVFLVIYFSSLIICTYVLLSDWNSFGFLLTGAEIIILFQVLFCIGIELYLYNFRNSNISLKWGLSGVAMLIIAFTIWNLSRTRESLWCNPDSLLQGHAIWHILDALAIYAFFKFYISEKKNLA